MPLLFYFFSEEHPYIFLERAHIFRDCFYLYSHSISFLCDTVDTGSDLYIFILEFSYLFLDRIQYLSELFRVRSWNLTREIRPLHRRHTEVLHCFRIYKLVWHKNHRSFSIDEASVGKGNLIDGSFVPFYLDSIADFEIVTENKGKTSKKIGDEFFTCKCEQNSSDSGTSYERTEIYTEHSKDENNRHYPNRDGNSPVKKGKYFPRQSVITDNRSETLRQNQIQRNACNIGENENTENGKTLLYYRHISDDISFVNHGIREKRQGKNDEYTGDYRKEK